MLTKLTGHAEIDHQHAILYSILEQLDQVCEEDKQNDGIQCHCPTQHLQLCRRSFANLFGEIMAFFVGHMTYEEKLMQLLPVIPQCQTHIERHKKAHAEVSEQISKLVFGAMAENPRVSGMQLRQVISEWMGEHVSKFDEPLARQLNGMYQSKIDFDSELVTMLDTHVFHNRPIADIQSATLPNVSSTATTEEIRTRLESLTPRQREVCLLMVDGIMNKTIADRLNTSINTIKTHRTEIFRKMEASSLLDLVRKIDMLRTTGSFSMRPGASLDDTIPQPLVSPAASLRVIVVEDNLPLQLAMVSGLKALGHEARGVSNSDELDCEIAAAPVDIVLLDIGLGSASDDGFTISARLRRYLHCGIIIITGRSEIDARIRGFEQGADAYLVKPVDFGELSAVMNSVVRRLGTARQNNESGFQ